MKVARGNHHHDRISELPDSLLIHILSFLDLKEAAITAVLSKRWIPLWAELPTLQFQGNMDPHTFVSWINTALAIRSDANTLHKFDVNFPYLQTFAKDVDAWIHFATQHKVKEFCLRFLNRRNFHEFFYRPPEAIYSCGSLTGLDLRGCFLDLDSSSTIQWHSLKYLHLWTSHVAQHVLDQILSACPVLHDLYLIACLGFDSLEADSPTSRLRSVTIADLERDRDDPPLRISAPYLHTLRVYVDAVKRRKLELVNVSSLTKAFVDFWKFPDDDDDDDDDTSVEEVMIGARDFLESVRHVEQFEVGRQFIKYVALMAANGWQLPKSKLKLLTVNCEYKYMIHGILGLLESSPEVEACQIVSCATRGEDVILEAAAKDDLAGDLLNLKTICIYNTVRDTNDESTILTLTRILFKRGTVLEYIFISNTKDVCELVKMTQTARTYPKTSTKASLYINCNDISYVAVGSEDVILEGQGRFSW